MRKRFIKLFILLVFLIACFVPTFTFAKSPKISIKSIEVADKSEEVDIVSEPTVENLNVRFDIRFYNVGNYVKYKMVIKNDDNEDYLIYHDFIDNNNNEYIQYEYDFPSNTKEIKAKSETVLYVTVKYKKLLLLKDIDVDGSYISMSVVQARITDLVGNPVTGRNRLLLKILLCALLVAIVAVLVIKKKRMGLALLLITPIIILADDSFEMQMHSRIEIVKSHLDTSYIVADDFTVDENFVRNNTFGIITLDTKDLPDTYLFKGVTYHKEKERDVSEFQNKQVMMGIYYDDAGDILLLCGEDGGVLLPINSERLFSLGVFQIIEYLDLTNTDAADIKNMNMMFSGLCYWGGYVGKKVTLIVGDWDTSHVETMSHTFDLTVFNDLSFINNWNTSRVTDMSYLFFDSGYEIPDISGWDTSNVTNMEGMFSLSRVGDVSFIANWDVSNVTNMKHMFQHSTPSNVEALSSWNLNDNVQLDNMFADDRDSYPSWYDPALYNYNE